MEVINNTQLYSNTLEVKKIGIILNNFNKQHFCLQDYLLFQM
jgi:hypothetical protein